MLGSARNLGVIAARCLIRPCAVSLRDISRICHQYIKIGRWSFRDINAPSFLISFVLNSFSFTFQIKQRHIWWKPFPNTPLLKVITKSSIVSKRKTMRKRTFSFSFYVYISIINFKISFSHSVAFVHVSMFPIHAHTLETFISESDMSSGRRYSRIRLLFLSFPTISPRLRTTLPNVVIITIAS